ncbi:MAG: GDP-mannose 4,6-dehydratase, partial [Halieaceae bacterium]|nr:GDP-mannose 4,6-dehydratase [Halieaceae bacterium]
QLALIRECAGPAVRLGNLASVRDWGYAPDYVKGMIMINEAKVASDYVIATNTVTSVREFFKASAVAAGFSPEFEGDGINERCVCKNTSKVLCEVDKKYFRPSDVNYLRGDYSKIEKELGWHPTTSLETMTEKMVISDIEIARAGHPPSF